MLVCAADYGGALICQKGAFLAGTHDLGIEMEFTKKLTTGFFGELKSDNRSFCHSYDCVLPSARLALWLKLYLDCIVVKGGEGFVLQRIQGEGDAFLKVSHAPGSSPPLSQPSITLSMHLKRGQAGGALIRRELKEGETLRVTSGALVAFSPTVEYEVAMMKG